MDLKEIILSPCELWWVYLLAMKLFTAAFAIMFNKIQVVPTLTKQQGSDLYILVLTHMDDIGCICALANYKLGAVKHNMNFKSGLFAISITSVRKF